MGSNKFCPPCRLLYSSEGIVLEAPILDSSGKSPQNEWITMTIQTSQILRMEASFKRDFPVIFLYVAPEISQKISARLGLNKDWIPAITEEIEKRLILLPVSLDDSAKDALRHAFVPRGLLREITCDYANNLIVKSLLPE